MGLSELTGMILEILSSSCCHQVSSQVTSAKCVLPQAGERFEETYWPQSVCILQISTFTHSIPTPLPPLSLSLRYTHAISNQQTDTSV